MTPHLGFGHDGVLRVIYYILICNATIEKASGEYGQVRGVGEQEEEEGDALGRDATFPWSNALTRPPRYY